MLSACLFLYTRANIRHSRLSRRRPCDHVILGARFPHVFPRARRHNMQNPTKYPVGIRKDKTVFRNCDAPYGSNFFKYFALHFRE